jgi:2-isopropylmalate synthase
MADAVITSARAGKIVLFEESPRDGAQAKTMMDADFRIELARKQGQIFGAHGPAHVIFAAGFPSIAPQEFEITRRVAVETSDRVSPSAICRGTSDDVRLALDAVRDVPGARIMIILPASEATAQAMTHRPAAQALAAGRDVVDLALGHGIAVDVCLADVPRADPGLVAEFASKITKMGAATVILADTIGQWLPEQARATISTIKSQIEDAVVLGVHLHNDLGLALANTLAAVQSGAAVVASSWLGIAERSGLVATEQLLFLLAHETEAALGPGADPWWQPPDLTRLPELARMVSARTGVPISVTTPIVGTGVGTISTGTPFADPQTYQPFDPRLTLGIEPRVLLTHLASTRVVRTVALDLGHELDRDQAHRALTWVKDQAYRSGEAVVPHADFAIFLAGLSGARV